MKKFKSKFASKTAISDECDYTVIKLIENDSILFDCIPDLWFTDEYKESCLWPPSKGKNVAVRALKKEIPDSTWRTYHCEVVKGGFATYSAGKTLVREKCAQKYNTSSAEEHIAAAKFRRQHPVLSIGNSDSFENVFASEKSVTSVANDQAEKSTSSAHKSSKYGDPEHSSQSCPISATVTDLSHQGNLSPTSIIFHKTVLKSAEHRPNNDESCSRSRRHSEKGESSASSIRSTTRRQLYDKRSSSRSTRSRSIRSRSIRSRSIRSRSTRSRSTHSRSTRSRSGRSRSGRSHSGRSHSDRSHSGRSHSGRSHSVRSRSTRSRSGSSRSTRSRSGRSSSDRSRSRSSRNNSIEHRNFSIELQKKKDNQNLDRSSERYPLPMNDSYRNRSTATASVIQSTQTPSNDPFKELMKEVRDTSKAVVKYHHEHDRRLTRMEVTINKILVRLGDITRSNAVHLPDDFQDVSRREDTRNYSGEGSRRENMRVYSAQGPRREKVRVFSDEASRRERDDETDTSHDPRSFPVPRAHRCPEFPVLSLSELTDVNQRLFNKDFFTFLVDREKEFCMPGKDVSNTVVITTYLKRFVSLRVRSLLTLKELKDVNGLTLFADFFNVYNFLITVVREAYTSCKKSITEKEAHGALRIVWGRSKQLLNDQKKNKK